MNPVSSQSNSSPPQTQTPYNHPMQDGFTPRGIIFQEVKDDINGRRYVSGEQISVDENGNEIVFSGISTIERRPLAQDELDDLIATGQRGYPRNYNSAPIISPGLEQMMSTASQDATFYVHVNFEPPLSYKPLIYRMEESIALGEVNTFEDRQLVRNEHLLTQQEEVRQVSIPIQKQITNLGGSIIKANLNLFSLDAILTSNQIISLSTHPSVSRINHSGILNENHLSGIEISRGTQMITETSGSDYVQFMDDEYTAEYLGNKGYFNRINIGILEHSSYNDEHPGFNDANGNSRIALRRNCHCHRSGIWPFYSYSPECSGVTNFPSTSSEHATVVAGIAAGDITQGQDDINIPSAIDQRQYSGFSRNSALKLWRAHNDYSTGCGGSNGDGLIDDAFDEIISYNPHLLSMSIEAASTDITCTGTDSLSRDANTVFEAGIPIIYAAGNDGHSSYTNCRIDSPGSAMGVFVVGGTTTPGTTPRIQTDQNTEDEVRYGFIYPNTSRGGTTSEGRGRTIIDIMAPACRNYRFSVASNNNYAFDIFPYQNPVCGTSYATPTVTAGAANLMDFYKYKYSNAMENPGKLYAHLLLMGDRAYSPSTGQPDSDFDNLWGGGRLKMRRWDAYGLDSPWGWGSLSTCIDDGEVYYKYLYNSNTFPSNTDIIKAVITWYDKRHENGTAIDNINFSLEECIPSGGICLWTSIYRFVSTSEEKERVFRSGNLGGKMFRLKIKGADVTSDDAGCGTNSMRVHFAWFYEDSSRDDPDGPNSDIDPE
jgi:hypothetical protein